MDVQGWSLVAAIHPIRDKCRNGRRGGTERWRKGQGLDRRGQGWHLVPSTNPRQGIISIVVKVSV